MKAKNVNRLFEFFFVLYSLKKGLQMKNRIILFAILFFGVFAGVCHAITIDATYIGGSGGNWNSASNWDKSVVPGNVGTVSFNVTIPAGITVNFDVVGDTEIDTLILGDDTTNDARLNFNAACNLKVLYEADIYGIIEGDSNTFTATGTARVLEGDRVRIFGENGAIIKIANDTYSSKGIWRSWDANGGAYGDGVGTWEPVILHSSGAGTLLDLSSVESLNAGFNASGNDYIYQYIIAEDGAALDLEELKTITGPVHYKGRLKLSVTGNDAELNLDSLSEIIGSYSGSYYYFSKVPFILDSATISMPALENTEQVSFSLSNGSSLELPAVTTMEDTQFIISGGSIVHDGIESSTHSTLNIWRNWDANGGAYGDGVGTWEPVILHSSGAGTLLDLSSVESLNAGFNASGNDYIYQNIIADDGAAIDLSGLLTMTGPVHYKGRLKISVTGNDTELNLDSLSEIIGSYGGSYYYFSKVPFILDSASLSMPALENTEQVSFSLVNGSSLELPAVESIQDTQFIVSGGSEVHEGTESTILSTLNIWRDWDANGGAYGDGVGTWEPVILHSSGAGTLLDLSSVESLNAGFNASGNDHIYQKVIADDNGMIDLSGVQTIIAPHGSDDKLVFTVSDGASIDMSSLNAINSASAGDVNITISGNSSVNMSSLKSFGADGNITLASSELLFGNVEFDANSSINIDGGSYLYAAGMSASSPVTLKVSNQDDKVEIDGNLELSNLLKIDAKEIGFTLKLAGDFTYNYIDETDVELGEATMHLDGSGVEQILEVGGLDVDIFVGLLSNDNFGFGQMIVGQDGQPTIVRLRDAVDNGNNHDVCGQPEAQYLFGIEGDNPNGLRILGDSELFLDGINLYSYQGGEWVHLNSLFAPEADEFAQIVFDGGIIRKGKLDADGDGLPNLEDNCALTYNPGQEDRDDDDIGDVCDYDFNNDSVVDSDDLALFAADFGRTDCTGPCIGNSDDDNDIDGTDLVAMLPIGKSIEIGFPGPSCVQ